MSLLFFDKSLFRFRYKKNSCIWSVQLTIRGVGKGGLRGSDDPPPFFGANLIHFLYKVLGLRSVQKKDFQKLTFKTTPPGKIPSYAPDNSTLASPPFVNSWICCAYEILSRNCPKESYLKQYSEICF